MKKVLRTIAAFASVAMLAATAMVATVSANVNVPANTLLIERCSTNNRLNAFNGSVIAEDFGFIIAAPGLDSFFDTRAHRMQMFLSEVNDEGGVFLVAANAANMPAGTRFAEMETANPAQFTNITAVEMSPAFSLVVRDCTDACCATASVCTCAICPQAGCDLCVTANCNCDDCPGACPGHQPPTPPTPPSNCECTICPVAGCNFCVDADCDCDDCPGACPGHTTPPTPPNPETGIALAIIPALLAAGAAVVVAKKRK